MLLNFNARLKIRVSIDNTQPSQRQQGKPTTNLERNSSIDFEWNGRDTKAANNLTERYMDNSFSYIHGDAIAARSNLDTR